MQMAMPRMTPWTKKLLIANFAIFAATFLLWLIASGITLSIFEFFGLRPRQWVDWFPALPLWQLVTSGFLHSVTSPTHVLWNMVQLYFFGTMLEGALGSRRFLFVYFGAMLVGGILHIGVEIATGALSPAIGASGAVLGIVVAMATLRPRARVFVFFIPVTLVLLAGAIVAIDLISALRDLKLGTSDGTAHWVHLGGALFGFASVKIGWAQTDWLDRFRAKRAIAGEQSRREDDLRMDQLLEKIHQEGMSSLSRKEKEFLKRASKRTG
jgi:membrane associated rhomboid family serine protease